MRLLSANLFLFPGFNAKRRATEFSRRVNQLGIEVLCLQEVHTYGLLRHLMRSIDPRLCYLKFEPGIIGPAGGLVIMSKSPISNMRYVSLGEVSRRLGRRVLWQNRALGAAHKGLLIAETDGVTVINYHGSPNHFETWEAGYGAEQVQTAQIEVLIATILGLKNIQRLVVAGDTNIDKSSGGLYGELLRRADLFDPFGTEPTCSGRTREFCCDVMLFGGSLGQPNVTEADVIFAAVRESARRIWTTAISDHSPLLADVEWRPLPSRQLQTALYVTVSKEA